MAGESAAVAASYSATIQAVKASGAIVGVDPPVFQQILGHLDRAVVVHAKTAFGRHKYIVSYGGLFFYTKARHALMLPSKAQRVEAKRIWVPSGWT